MSRVRQRLTATIGLVRALAVTASAAATLVAVSLAAVAFVALYPHTADAADPPNIIFILVDDQRYDELGSINPILDTPNLDALAERGVFFENAIVTTSLCSPSRATILTGPVHAQPRRRR